MTGLTRDEKVAVIVDHAYAHDKKKKFAEGVVGLRGLFALGSPAIFEDIIDDLCAEIDESAQIGRAMVASLDGPIH